MVRFRLQFARFAFLAVLAIPIGDRRARGEEWEPFLRVGHSDLVTVP